MAEPICPSCDTPWTSHLGPTAMCARLVELESAVSGQISRRDAGRADALRECARDLRLAVDRLHRSRRMPLTPSSRASLLLLVATWEADAEETKP